MRRALLLALLAGLVAVLTPVAPASAGEGDQGGDGPTTTLQGFVEVEGEDGEDVAVEGVEFLVEGTDFDETAATGADGRWSVDAPAGAAPYTVTLDVETLPEGVELREGTEAVRSDVNPTISPFNIIFRFGEAAERDVAGGFERFISLFVAGVRLGLVIAMAAVGLSLIFGTTGLVNFAHGELLTLGAVMAYVLNVTLSVPFLLVLPMTVVLGGLLGYGVDKGLFHPLRRRGTGLIAMLVVTIGMSLLVRYAVQWRFGGQPRPFREYSVARPLVIGPINTSTRDLVLIVGLTLVLVAFGLALQNTRLGKATRAVSDNPALAAASGIDVERVINRVWVVGTALAALGGVVLGLVERVQWNLGFIYLLFVFSAVILGGLGTAFGAMLGALVIGILIQVSTLVVPTELQTVVALGVLILVLLVRPQGLLGRSERVG